MSKITHRDCVEYVADKYRIDVLCILGKERVRRIAHPRQLAFWLIRELTDLSQPQIGVAVGNRHHTTVMSGIRACTARSEESVDFAAEIQGDIQNIRQLYGPAIFYRSIQFKSRRNLRPAIETSAFEARAKVALRIV